MPVGMNHSLMEQGGGLLAGGLAMDLDHSMGTQYSTNPPVTIDVPMSPGALMGHSQLTTIDQSELSSQLGLSLGGSSILQPAAQSPEERLSTTPSPTSSLQEDEPEEFRRQVPAQKASPVVLDVGRKQKPAKKQKKKKDPNEPQKPVSAYALFFRDTQAAIKGQNPNATFGEVSKIVASMWDSLGEEQKQVYKRKTEAAKKEYLKALAAYRAIQTAAETAELDLNPVPPPAAPAPAPAPAAPSPTPTPPAPSPVLESTPAAPQPAPTAGNLCSPPPAQPSFTKIIIPKQILPSSLAVSSQGGVVTVIPVTSRGLQLGTGATQIVTRSVLQAAAAAMQLPRLQPPPLQQMPPPQPPAQQVAVLQPPPPLQAMQQPALRLHLQQQPPPLQIKILPPPALQIQPVTLQPEEASPEPQGSPEPVEMITADVVPEVESPTQMEVELVSESPVGLSPRPRCVRSGCDNLPVSSSDWDNEYCSSECVVKHCRDVFLAWLASRNFKTAWWFVKFEAAAGAAGPAQTLRGTSPLRGGAGKDFALSTQAMPYGASNGEEAGGFVSCLFWGGGSGGDRRAAGLA
ncbi:TOX high mobility group box family member 4 [Chelydra serpentina]|uniref:TOX high mobility group box family member 4 n=1 Tax=Chelydra serpentina TaxID=8475 RepID=A0A8T1S075_CHESE|nr:TOX high mobility group box family member 4 [Chelydra serpentina]